MEDLADKGARYHLDGQGYKKINREYPQIRRAGPSVAIKQTNYKSNQVAGQVGYSGNKIYSQGHAKKGKIQQLTRPDRVKTPYGCKKSTQRSACLHWYFESIGG